MRDGAESEHIFVFGMVFHWISLSQVFHHWTFTVTVFLRLLYNLDGGGRAWGGAGKIGPDLYSFLAQNVDL